MSFPKISKMHWVQESVQADIWDISRVWGSPCRTEEVGVGDKACQSLVEWSIGSSDVCRWKSRYQWDGSVVFWGILRFMGWQKDSPKITSREQFPTFPIQSSVNRCVCTEWRGLFRYALQELCLNFLESLTWWKSPVRCKGCTDLCTFCKICPLSCASC